MISRLFLKSKQTTYCKYCKKDVKGKSQRKLVVLPKSLIIVVDRFNDKGRLQKLVSSFPDTLDLNKYVIDDNKSTSTYSLAGFVSQDPLMHDYNVCLKNKQKEKKHRDHDWIIFNKRGMSKATTDIMFSNSASYDAQIFMYNLNENAAGHEDE